jgi:hypothetical protein
VRLRLILTRPSTQGSPLPISGGVSVDHSLRERWERELQARARARRSLPPKWLDDPRPEMREVCETYVELMVREFNRLPAQASRRAAT